MRRKLCLLSALCVSMLAAADQPFDIRPGLWKVALTIDAGGGAHTRSNTSCITAEDLRSARALQLTSRPDASCRSEVTRQSATALEGVVHCAAGGFNSRTDVSYAASSPTRFSGTMRATGGNAPQPVAVKIDAEWVGAQCPAAQGSLDGED